MSSVSSSAYGAGDSDSSRTLAKRPRKNERARRERLRKRYIEMIEEMTSQQLDFTDRSLVDNVQRDLKQSTGMAMYVTDLREASYDMKYLKHLSEICSGLATNLSVDTKFDTCEFLHKEAMRIRANQPSSSTDNLQVDLGLLTNELASSCLQIPDVSRHITSSDSLPEFRNSVVKVKRMAVRANTTRAEGPAVIVRGTEVTEDDDGKDCEKTAETVERLFQYIWNAAENYSDKTLDFFEVVLDPSSFGRTVENIFYLSFLVRDGYIHLFLDENKLPAIKPQKNPKEYAASKMTLSKNGDGSSDGAEGNQLVIGLNMEEWKLLCDEWKIETAFFERL